MKYRIGEVSNILKLSDQMIRYYEKNGVIQPHREGKGQYRYYTDMDIFQLFDAMRYKEWGIGIGEIKQMVEGDYFGELGRKLDSYSEELAKEIRYKTILSERVNELKGRIMTCTGNIGSYWVELVPAHVLYYLGESKGEEYNMITIDEKMADIIYSSKYISFFDPYVEYENGEGVWWYVIRKKYHDTLKINDSGVFREVPEQLCLCTVIDMGEPGAFTGELAKNMEEIIAQKGMKPVGKASGFILGRGHGPKGYHRLMRIKIPVETL